MIFFIYISSIFLPTITCQMSSIGDAIEIFNPCEDFILSMQRIIGGPPTSENYWDGTFYLDKWPNLTEIRIGLTVDNSARMELDENIGRVLVQGKKFHISVYHQPGIKTVQFKVRGQPKGAFPNVDNITLNDENVCKNPRKWSPTILGSSGNIGETETDKEVKPKCGKPLVEHKGLIANGFPTKEGDWPWHAAIFHLIDLKQDYRCGGTLISSSTVLTAGHCLYEFGRAIVAERVLVQLGKHNLQLAGPNTQEFQAHKLVIHDRYNQNDLLNDIALIRLATEVTFSSYIQPICLWNINKISLSNVIDKNGIVVGWGYTQQDKVSKILNQAYMPVISFTQCLASNRNFFGLFLSDNTFCAGFRNGTSVCNGDSGGGMYFEENGIYSLRGIVSLAVSRSDDPSLCNPEEYVIFTDAAQYLDWIIANSM